MGVHSAVIHYNDGRKGVLTVLEHFGLCGVILKNMAKKLENSRIN